MMGVALWIRGLDARTERDDTHLVRTIHQIGFMHKDGSEAVSRKMEAKKELRPNM